MNIGDRIRSLRERRDWTQKSLAEKVGINHSVFNRIESGERKVRSDELSRIAEVLGVSTDFLSGKISEPKKYNDGDMTIKLIEKKAQEMGLGLDDPRFQKMLHDAFELLRIARGQNNE